MSGKMKLKLLNCIQGIWEKDKSGENRSKYLKYKISAQCFHTPAGNMCIYTTSNLYILYVLHQLIKMVMYYSSYNLPGQIKYMEQC